MKYGIRIGGILCLGIALFATLSSVEQNSTETSQIQYIQNPPIAKNYWVQKIRTPDGVQGGEYSVVIKAEFEHDLPLPEVLNVYKNGEVAQVLHDDGNYPDERANDGIFATIVNQDPTEFANEVMARINNIQSRGYNMKFTGHLGEVVEYRDIKPFNIGEFQRFQIQEFDEILLEGVTPCDMQDEILKQNSLLITDLDVVEDEGRTFNVVTGQGASQGAWTFGELMKNMAGGYADESAPTDDELEHVRDFLKEWIIQLSTQYSVNGKVAQNPVAHKVTRLIPHQWIRIAKGDPNFPVPPTGDNEGWQEVWDTSFTTAEDINTLLASAPFKLTAIVNRIDLRGNRGYENGSNVEINAGETRFIFSLIHGVDGLLIDGNSPSNQGKVPIFYPNAPQNGSNAELIDWNGMNVIFEYSNIASSSCEIKELGLQWKRLSNLNLEDSTQLPLYLDSLQMLTDLVTTRNVNPNGINGSAISQVRTNTRLFSGGTNNAKWNLREFRLDETTGFLVNSPTRNMPFADNNTRRNSNHLLPMDPNASSEDIVNWIYGVNGPSKAISVRHGNHNIPEHLLNPTSRMADDIQSYYGLGFWNTNFPDNIYDDDNYTLEASLKNKEIRQQLSLNTCLGCHGAETKTLFTMIRPLGYGEEANYWDLAPSTTTGKLHTPESTIDNAGTTLDSTHIDAVDGFIDNYNQSYYEGSSLTELRTVPNVSPFLTGRNFRDGDDLSGDDRWNDDFEKQGSDDEVNLLLRDQEITGLFYVNDPSNEADVTDNEYVAPGANSNNASIPPFPQHHDKKFGFNELENRQMDLCRLTSTSCSNADGGVLDILAHLDFVPLPLHGH